MKTFEEAIECLRIDPAGGPELKTESLNGIGQEVLASRLAAAFLDSMITACANKLPADMPPYNFAMSVCMSAFSAGVRVGIEMEKQS